MIYIFVNNNRLIEKVVYVNIIIKIFYYYKSLDSSVGRAKD